MENIKIKCDVCGEEFEDLPKASKFTLDNFENFCPSCAHRVQMAALYKAYEIQMETKVKGEHK